MVDLTIKLRVSCALAHLFFILGVTTAPSSFSSKAVVSVSRVEYPKKKSKSLSSIPRKSG